MLKHIFDKILDNWLAKIVIFILVLLIFYFYTASELISENYIIPLHIKPSTSLILMNTPPTDISVTIYSKKKLPPQSFSHIRLYVDLSKIQHPGKYTLPIHYDWDTFHPKAQLVIHPRFVPINLIKKITKTVPIVGNLKGQPQFPFYVSYYQISPPKITIAGPEYLLNSITHIQAHDIDISHIDHSMSRVIKLNPLPENVYWVNPKKITIHVFVEKQT